MKKSIIVAMSQNGVIGIENQLPWHLPNDLKYFKKNTVGKPLIMGRRTFESIGRPLPNRLNIIVSRQSGLSIDGVHVASSLEAAFDIASKNTSADGEVMIAGGSQIYQLGLPLVDSLYVTHVHTTLEGDAYFPNVDWSNWQESFREDHKKCEKNSFDYSFVRYGKCF
ncbi:dihydrofolate reductase [Marinibactrum halimedae]|uniref:Dihydrofolate reductase n=1 Tax=Marinibactrum halimedae TaxID=1444977 RepID=A0AA37T7L6_9GAMM|nr:dihydrofolate reductase [Marinibactrum halimedae]MCD9458772.1 dihydrofolate reductase [Marinibactrum halimedae]GLS25331.1 dihydrofolate reductase [Marinibactrum halimedae]